MRTGATVDRIWQGIGDELRHSARRPLRTPAFTVPAALTLALAIGANASIFAIVHRVVLNPLPYGDSDRLIAVDFGMPVRNIASGLNTIPSRLYYQYLDRSRALTGIAVYRPDGMNVTGQGSPERLRVVRTTASFAPVLRVAPAILERVSALPGVRAAAASTCLPLAEHLCQGGPLFIEGRPIAAGGLAPFVASRAVTGRYFEAMGMRMLRGRGLDQSDIEREEPVVVVNQALVNVSFPNQDPIGQRVRFGNPAPTPGTPEWLTIVGVVSNTPGPVLAESTPGPQLFMPMFASRNVNMSPQLDAMSFVVRTTLAPESLAPAVRGAIGGFDGNLPIAGVRTLQDILDRAAAQMAFTMVLLLMAGGVALLLGMIGIYGVMSYVVTQRTAEIGLRLTLGAKPASVAGAIVREGGVVALIGIAAGLVIAGASGQVMASLIYGISPRDPIVFAATTLGLFLLTLVACWVPARRAARLNPVDALRMS